MIHKIAGFKRHAALSLCSIALISAACSDDNDDVPGGSAGTSSGAGSGGKASGGSAGAKAGSGNGGATAGSSTTGGTSNGAGTSGADAGAAGASGNAGNSGAGMGGEGGLLGGAGGQGGEGGNLGGEGPLGGAGSGGEGGEGGAPFVADVLDNPGFEITGGPGEIPGWTNEGTTGAAFIEQTSAHTGFARLGHWTQWVDASSPAYTARTYQTVGPIPNGTYSFSIWVDRAWFQDQYLFARGFDATDPALEKTMVTTEADTPTGYVKVTLSGIEVTSGTCTVGVYSAAPAGTYANFDDAELTLE